MSTKEKFRATVVIILFCCAYVGILIGVGFFADRIGGGCEATADDSISTPGSFSLVEKSTDFKEIGIKVLSVIHDNERNVTCWVAVDSQGSDAYGYGRGVGISCLPDNEIHLR